MKTIKRVKPISLSYERDGEKYTIDFKGSLSLHDLGEAQYVITRVQSKTNQQYSKEEVQDIMARFLSFITSRIVDWNLQKEDGSKETINEENVSLFIEMFPDFFIDSQSKVLNVESTDEEKKT